MKKLLTIIGLLFIFRSLMAPCLLEVQESEMVHRMMEGYQRTMYEKHYESQKEKLIEHLSHKESNHNWKAINTIGCMGEWQFTVGTLRSLGYKNITPGAFKENPNIFSPEIQKNALVKLMDSNLKGIKSYMGYVGKVINGVKITKSGLIAAMHLGGQGSVRAYLRTNGNIDKHDAYGTKISDYIREFSMHNLSNYNPDIVIFSSDFRVLQ